MNEHLIFSLSFLQNPALNAGNSASTTATAGGAAVAVNDGSDGSGLEAFNEVITLWFCLMRQLS